MPDPGPGLVPLDVFVAARLAEDEAVAVAAQVDWREFHEPSQYHHGLHLDLCGGEWERLPDEHAAHIARHDPARVLAEVAAHRRTIAAYRAARDWSLHKAGIGIALKAIAGIWADHPDYNPTWRDT